MINEALSHMSKSTPQTREQPAVLKWRDKALEYKSQVVKLEEENHKLRQKVKHLKNIVFEGRTGTRSEKGREKDKEKEHEEETEHEGMEGQFEGGKRSIDPGSQNPSSPQLFSPSTCTTIWWAVVFVHRVFDLLMEGGFPHSEDQFHKSHEPATELSNKTNIVSQL